MLFQYVDRKGELRTVEAASAAEAMTKAKDIDPKSGVAEVRGQQKQRTERDLPAMDKTATRDLPQDSAKSAGRLTSLTAALTHAVDLGRKKRNRLLQGVVGSQFGGTLRASGFADILDAAGKVSDRTFETILDTYNQSLETGNPDVMTTTDDAGTVYGIDKNTGVVLWRQAGVGKADGSGGATEHFSEEQKRILQQAGLAGADPEVQDAFANIARMSGGGNFIASWMRNNPGDNSGTKLDALIRDVEAWEQAYSDFGPRTAEDDDAWIEKM